MTVWHLLLPLAGYLLGSIPTGVIIANSIGIDLRKVGSGNIGATNVTRALGKKWGAVTLLGDAVKGFLPVLAARYAAGDPGWQADLLLCSTALAAFLGHCYSVFLRFQGGKGVATGLGVYLALAPLAALLALATWILTFALYRLSALAALAGVVSLVLSTFMIYPSRIYLALSVVVASVLFYTHRENITRMRAGKEKGIGGSTVS